VCSASDLAPVSLKHASKDRTYIQQQISQQTKAISQYGCGGTYRASKFSSECDTTPAIPQQSVLLMCIAVVNGADLSSSSSRRLLLVAAAAAAVKRPSATNTSLVADAVAVVSPRRSSNNDRDDVVVAAASVAPVRRIVNADVVATSTRRLRLWCAATAARLQPKVKNSRDVVGTTMMQERWILWMAGWMCPK